MKKILDKLNELVLICETRVKKVDDEKEKNAARTVILDAQEKAIKDLNEIAVEGLERLNNAKVKHEDLADAKRIKEELSAEMNRYQGLQKDLQSKFDDANKAKIDGLAEVERQKEKLQAERSKLEEDKKTYKKDIMSSISKELKSKGIEL